MNHELRYDAPHPGFAFRAAGHRPGKANNAKQIRPKIEKPMRQTWNNIEFSAWGLSDTAVLSFSPLPLPISVLKPSKFRGGGDLSLCLSQRNKASTAKMDLRQTTIQGPLSNVTCFWTSWKSLGCVGGATLSQDLQVGFEQQQFHNVWHIPEIVPYGCGQGRPSSPLSKNI